MSDSPIQCPRCKQDNFTSQGIHQKSDKPGSLPLKKWKCNLTDCGYVWYQKLSIPLIGKQQPRTFRGKSIE